ncbi:MAG: hypothetical protein ACXAC2_04980 [Candidatus Kariarchaeaceae archaeon]|jgi:hypothetical protein
MAVEDPSPNMTETANIDKTEVKFYSYGILTLPILPLLLLAVHLILLAGAPQIYFLGWLIIVIRLILRSRKDVNIESSNIFSRLLYTMVELTFGVRTSNRNTHQYRLEWFLLFGGPVVGLLLLAVYASIFLVFPVILILIKRKWILRNTFKLALLPRSEYFVDNLSRLIDEKEEIKMKQRRDKQERELQYQSQMEYLHFYPPNRKGRLFSYLFLFITPIIFVGIFATFLSLVLETEVQETITDTAGIALIWGYIGIIPYFILSLFRGKRITKFTTTTLAETIVSTMASTSINYLPMFNGDYYFEQNSRVVDMSDTFGFFEIFKSGRWFTIFLLPLAAISFIFTQILSSVDSTTSDQGEPLDTNSFLKELSFNKQTSGDTIFVQSSGALIFYVILLLPILISILLPLMWVLKDSELKRTTWEQDEGGGERKEISGVEDLGQTLNRIFGLFLGLSTITGLSSITRRLVDRDASQADVYIIVFIMMIIGALLVLPGTLFMAYRYFSLGDHQLGVNYLRYNLAKSENIGVGTIVKGYDTILNLPEPLSPIIKQQVEKDK